MAISRRQFCLRLGAGLTASVMAPRLLKRSWAKVPTAPKPYIREARYYTNWKGTSPLLLCPRTFLVTEGRRVTARPRKPKRHLSDLSLRRLCSINNDPIRRNRFSISCRVPMRSRLLCGM
jgi:hypothetical protein